MKLNCQGSAGLRDVWQEMGSRPLTHLGRWEVGSKNWWDLLKMRDGLSKNGTVGVGRLPPPPQTGARREIEIPGTPPPV